MNNYRKIYKNHYGKIPTDETGRSYEIHHIDGNHTNNNISNLKLVTIQEHYNIHYSQQDWGACQAIAIRMEIDHATISEMARKSSLARVAKGTHPFSGPAQNVKKVANGTHPSKIRMENKTHNFLGENHPMKVASANGTHHFSSKKLEELKQTNPDKFAKICKQRSDTAFQRIANGTHAGVKIFSTYHTCPHCGKQGKGAIMYRFHYDNCKTIKKLNIEL